MLYELTLTGRYYGKPWINTFNYLSGGIPASVSGSFALTDAFGAIDDGGIYPTDRPLHFIRTIMTTDVAIDSVVVRAPLDYDVEDFYERPFLVPLAGLTSGTGMSPNDAYGLKTNRVRLDIDRGMKRFVGVSEAHIDAGGAISASMMTALANLATSLSDILEYEDEGNTMTFAPCIVSKERYIPSSGKPAYRYYDTLAEQLEHIADGILWQPFPNKRHQDSRED